MNDDVERIVEEVVAQLAAGRAAGSPHPAGPAFSSAVQSVLILTEDLPRVSTVLGAASRRQRQAISVFVGGSPRRRSNTAGLGELFFADEVRHRQIDFVSRFETFFLFGVSLPTIARLAQLVISEPLEVIAFDALSRAKAVLMEPIAGGPVFEGMPAAVKEEFSRFAQRLATYGVREERPEAVFAITAPLAAARELAQRSAVGAQGDSALSSPASEHPVRAVILTVRDVQELVGPGSQMAVSGPYRLTDLAREYVEKNGIVIQAR